jgi:hypothetical protein
MTHNFIFDLPVVLYEYESWCLTLNEERRFRVFENKMIKRREITGECRELHNESFNF